jgi:GNAT superfamily N-acetyltransferase
MVNGDTTSGRFSALRLHAFSAADADALVEILALNGQYGHPEVEGPAAMERVAACSAAVFIVAEISGRPCGFIRGVYDGSRALIHLLSVHPGFQRSGIGTALAKAAAAEFKRRGAPTMSVTVTEASAAFWERLGFEALPVFLMLKEGC